MGAFLVRRLLSGLLLIVTLTFLTFFVFNEIPTNPACIVVACGPHTTTTDAMIREADHRLGIDRSLFVQYGKFVWNLVRNGDFGSSWTQQAKVGTMLGAALPVTASLVAGGMLLMLLLAVPLGSLAAVRPRSPADRGLLVLTLAGIAVHPFVLGLILLQFFTVHLHIYDFSYCPIFGASPAGCGGPLDWAAHLAVPWFVFALLFLPLYMRMIRVRMLETLGEPWISTARAKGASEPRVVFGHALRNAIGPVLPMLAVDAGTAITAAIYVETVFGLQGIGSLAVRALSGTRGGFDLPLTAGVVTVVGTFVVLLNIAADVAGVWLDPRIRTRSASGLIPLPQALASRPRVRMGLNIAAGAAAVALVALIVTNRGSHGGGPIALGQPVKTLHVNWDDVTRLEAQTSGAGGLTMQHGYLETHVSEIEFGRYGWRVHASITNKSPLRILVTSGADTPGAGFGRFSYPNQPMSLIVQGDQGLGFKGLNARAATEFIPALPKVLGPHATWRGTFAGRDPVEHGALLYAGFGQFAYERSPYSRPFSASSNKSAHAP